MSIKINSTLINNSYNNHLNKFTFTSENAKSVFNRSSSGAEITPNIKVSTKNVVPEELSTYVSDIKDDSKDMMKIITDLYKNQGQGDTKEMYRSMKKFTDCFNDIVDTNKEYSTDEGIKKLTKKLKNLVEDNKEELEEMGITLKGDGKLLVNTAQLAKAAEDGTLDEFLTSNRNSLGKKSFVDEVRKISKKMYRDQTTFLSDKAKAILENPIVNYKEIINESPTPDDSNKSEETAEDRKLGSILDINA